MKVGINSVAETLQMINESSFPVTDIYLTLANINFLFYQFSLNYIKNAPLLKKRELSVKHSIFDFNFVSAKVLLVLTLGLWTSDLGLTINEGV